jgi:hypothetical protein
MALSSERYPGMRGQVISEARPSFPSSGEIFAKDSSLLQAISMGLFSKVEITLQEACLYKALRGKTLEEVGTLKSDQVLMAEDVLTGEKSAQFKKAFPYIFSPLH